MNPPRFTHRAAFTVIGLARQFTMNNKSIHLLWAEYDRRKQDIPNALPDASYGVCYHEPMENMSPDSPFTYLAGKAVTSDADIPEGMTSRQIPEADYAVFEHRGALDTLHGTYGHIFREWLPTSGYESADQDDFEVYDRRFNCSDPDSIMEIWIPIRKK